jgi:hypothetical protein
MTIPDLNNKTFVKFTTVEDNTVIMNVDSIEVFLYNWKEGRYQVGRMGHCFYIKRDETSDKLFKLFEKKAEINMV